MLFNNINNIYLLKSHIGIWVMWPLDDVSHKL